MAAFVQLNGDELLTTRGRQPGDDIVRGHVSIALPRLHDVYGRARAVLRAGLGVRIHELWLL
jgi:hypothetical protein